MRDKGAGSVYKSADGRWRATIEGGYTASGNRRRIYITAPTKTEAQTKLKAKLRQIAESGVPDPGTAGTTVKAWSETWLRRRASTMRPKAQIRDESCVRRWIVPTIGHRRLTDLNPGHIRSITDAMVKADRSSSSARRVQSTLAKMLKDATTEGYPVPSRVLLVKKPSLAVNDRVGLTAPEAIAMLTTASGGDRSRWGAALMEGVRSGEARGLTWECVDLDAGTMDISWQLQDLPYEHGCDGTCGYKRAGACPQRHFKVPDGYEFRHLAGAWCLVRPKTASGRRILPVVPWLAAALSEWRDLCPASSYGLVWPDGDGNPRRPADDMAAWRELQARAHVAHPSGRRYLVHETRHATATLLMAMSVPEPVRIAIMGHAAITSTRQYEHSDIEMARQALDAMAGRLGLTA